MNDDRFVLDRAYIVKEAREGIRQYFKPIVWVARLIRQLVQHFIKATVWITLRLLYRIRITDQGGRIPDKGAYVLIPNHVSFIDAALIAAHIRRPIAFAMYWRIYNKVKWIVAPMGAFPIAGREENPLVYDAAFETIGRVLDKGGLVCIFPEGKITLTGEVNEFRTGLLKILTRNPVPVIPVGLRGLWGSYFSKKKPGLFKLPDHFMTKIEMRVGHPLNPTAPLDDMRAAVLDLLK